MEHQDQIQQMIELVNKQTELVNRLSIENASLRQQQSSSVKKPDRPVIEANLSDNDWALFLDTWSRYKRMTKVSDEEEKTMELRACCSADINKLLFDFVGPATLNTATESSLLAHIKSVSVKGVHKEVHRLAFVKIRQADNEPVVKYVARLQAQAALCDFTVACPTTGCQRVSYAEEMVAHQLIAGLINPEFQSMILSEATTLTSLKLKVECLQTLESTEESTHIMQPSPPPHAANAFTGASASMSQYRRSKEAHPEQKKVCTPDGIRTCTGCGR